MPDDSEEARWKARYERVAAAHQDLASAIARLEARIEAAEKNLADKAVDVATATRVAKADREATRKRRFAERVEATRAALEVRIANAQVLAAELAKRGRQRMTVQSELWRTALAEGKRRNKYSAESSWIDGHRFASKAEAKYYMTLKLRERLGEVTDVRLQEPFTVLGPKGQVVCTYRADFTFWDVKEGRRRVIDVKGMQTPLFKLKKRVVEAFLGIQIELAD